MRWHLLSSSLSIGIILVHWYLHDFVLSRIAQRRHQCYRNNTRSSFQMFLDHLLDQSIDVLLSVTKITTLNKVLEFAGSEATCRVGQLERPQEVAGLLEIGSDGVDLMDQVFHADNAIFAKIVLDQLVVCQGNSLFVDLSITTLVDELSHRLEVGVSVGDVGVDDCQHLLRGLGQSDEDAVVDLKKSEKLEDLSRLGSHLVDTLNSNDEDKLVLLLDIEVSILSAQPGKSDLLAFLVSIFLDV